MASNPNYLYPRFIVWHIHSHITYTYYKFHISLYHHKSAFYTSLIQTCSISQSLIWQVATGMTKKHRSKKMSCDDDQYPKLFLYYCQGALIETKCDTKRIELLSFKFIKFLYAYNICNKSTFFFYYKTYSCPDTYV